MFLEIYHHIRPYLNREITVTKAELLKKFPDRKKMVNDVWTCVTELKLVWPYEIIGRVIND